MWNLKYGTNEPIFEVETDSQTYRTDLGLPRKPQAFQGEGETRSLGLVDANCYTEN